MISDHFAGLTPEQTSLFIEAVDSSLRISRRDQFFNWLQGSCQYLVPHEVMICGIQSAADNRFHFDRFVSTRYFSEQHFLDATCKDGLVDRIIQSWDRSRRPVFLADGIQQGNFGSYTVPFSERPGLLKEMELRNILAHGIGSREEGTSTFFIMSRLPGQPTATQAYLFELLVPHLHSVLVRFMRNSSVLTAQTSDITVTLREREILLWLHHGKTNWEIASILDISPLTVKNHVQNILRKLNVQNRSHAAVKASKLGLVKPS